jgi:hypothetical protein
MAVGRIVLPVTLLPLLVALAGPSRGLDEKQVSGALRKAADFMMNTVSNRGGFLWHYAADLSEQWGEVPARKSQIWIQPPSTPDVGLMFLEAYKVTGDRQYLTYAERGAEGGVRRGLQSKESTISVTIMQTSNNIITRTRLMQAGIDWSSACFVF